MQLSIDSTWPEVAEDIQDALAKQWEDHADPRKNPEAKRKTTITVTSWVDKDSEDDAPSVTVKVSQKLAPTERETIAKIVDTPMGKNAQMRLY